MSNISGLNTEESKWVCGFLAACCNGKNFTEKPPSDKAYNHIIDTMKELSM